MSGLNLRAFGLGLDVRASNAVASIFGFASDYTSGVLDLGSATFDTASNAAPFPATVAGGHAAFSGAQAIQTSDENALAALSGDHHAVHVVFEVTALATMCLFSAGSGTNNVNYEALYLMSDGDLRSQVDGPGATTADNDDTTTTPVTVDTPHLASLVYHNKADGTPGLEVSIYLDGIPQRTNLAVDYVTDPYTLAAFGARVGNTNANYFTGNIMKGTTIQALTDATREAQVLAACSQMRSIMDGHDYLSRTDAVLLTLAGQSNALGSGTINTDPIDLANGVLTGIDVSNEAERKMVFDLDDLNESGVTRIKAQSPASGFASQMFAKTGKATIAAQVAVTGSPVLDASAAQSHWEFDGDDSNGLLTATTALASSDPDAPTQAELLNHVSTTLTLHPGINAASKIVLWDQSQADSGAMTAGTGATGDATYAAALLKVAQHFLDDKGYDLFVIQEAPTQGVDQTAVDANEPGKVLLRGAQQTVVDADSRIVWGAEMGAEVGSPFDTLVTDGDGAYVSGRSFLADGTHYDQVMSASVGRSTANAAITALSLPVTTVTASVLGFNDFGHNSFFPGHIFTNLKHQLKEWESDAGTLVLDANGFPTAFPAGATQVQSVIDWATNGPNDPTGAYVFEYTAGNTWTITGAVTIDSHVTPSGGDNGVISFTVTGSGQIIIRMTGTAGDPITSEIVHWCHDTPADLARLATAKTAEAAGNYNTPEIYNADYLAGYVSNSIPISSMRVMNTMETNDSQVTSWTGASYVPARRPLPSDTNQTTKGLAFEFLVGMANATNSDLWITPPHLADDAYITAIAAYCRDNLNSGLELRVEYSNEGWNSLFDQSKWLVQEAVKEWGDDITTVTFTNGSADITVSNNPTALVQNGLVVFTDADGNQNHYRVPLDWNGTDLTFTTNRTVTSASGTAAGKAGGDWGDAYQAIKAEDQRTVWEAEWTAGANVIHVLGAQPTSSGAAVEDMIDGTVLLALDGAATVPHTIFDECAINSYYGEGFTGSADRDTLQVLINTDISANGGDFSISGAWMRDYLISGTAQYCLPALRQTLINCVAKMVGKIAPRLYEGGPHWANGLASTTDDENFKLFAAWFHWSSYGITVREAHFDLCADEVGAPYNIFARWRPVGGNAYWGMDRYVGENSALFQAIEAKDAATLPWWLPAYPPQLKSDASTTFAINTNEAGSIDLKALHRANVSTVTLDAVPGGMTLTDGVLTWTALTATEDVTLTPTMTAQTTDSESLDTGLTFDVTYVAGPTYGDVISMSHGNNVDPSLITSFGVIPAVNWQRVSGFGTITGTNLEDQSGAATTLDLAATSSGGNADTRATGSGAAYDMMRRGASAPAAAMSFVWSMVPYTKYDVIVYFDENSASAAGALGIVSDGTTTHNLTATDGTANYTGTFVEDAGAGGNYVVFSGLTSASVTITFEGDSANRLAWTGTQFGERTN